MVKKQLYIYEHCRNLLKSHRRYFFSYRKMSFLRAQSKYRFHQPIKSYPFRSIRTSLSIAHLPSILNFEKSWKNEQINHNKNQLNHNQDDNNSNSNRNSNNNNYSYTSFSFSQYVFLATLGFSLSFVYNQFFKSNKFKWNDVSACGIMAMIGDEEVVDYLLEGLLILQNRGYDSAGVATIDGTKLDNNDDRQLKVTKFASKGSTSDSLELLKRQSPQTHMNDKIGIAHTRWATHGAKTDANAHPHMDYKNRIAIVHNGTIENSTQIKVELQKIGIPFKSQTDTEVIANLVSYYLDIIDKKTNKPKYDIESALQMALSKMEGSWGIAMLYKDRPNEIFAARYGSPLIIGLDPIQGRNFVASEHTAFARYTNEFIPLDDGEIAIVSKDHVSLENYKSRIQKAPSGLNSRKKGDSHSDGDENLIDMDNVVPLSPSPFDHWTLKEMMEQPAAVSRALAYGSRLSFDNRVKLGGLDSSKELLLSIENLVMTGCGTSYHAGLYAQRLMQYLNSFETVTTVDAAEVITDTFPSHDAGLLAISQSGETKDVLNALRTAETLAVPRLSVVNAVGSMIARLTGLGVYAYAGREHAVASTKAFLSQTTVLALIAVWFAQHRLGYAQDNIDPNYTTILQDDNTPNFGSFNTLQQHRSGSSSPSPISQVKLMDKQRRDNLVGALHRLPTYCGVTLYNTRETCKSIAQELFENKVEHMFVLGKGFAEPIAYEGALKLKEITYVHCEGYSGGALKHGPFALIEQGTPCIMIILEDEHSKTMITNAHEIESRGGKMIYITNNINLIERNGLQNERVVQIPSNGCLTALLAVIPLQYMAYELAVKKGINPDKPKNLAKAVTVD